MPLADRHQPPSSSAPRIRAWSSCRRSDEAAYACVHGLRNFLRLVAIVHLRELVPNQHLANHGGIKLSSSARNLSHLAPLSRLWFARSFSREAEPEHRAITDPTGNHGANPPHGLRPTSALAAGSSLRSASATRRCARRIALHCDTLRTRLALKPPQALTS
jgi:hypothetical protein